MEGDFTGIGIDGYDVVTGAVFAGTEVGTAHHSTQRGEQRLVFHNPVVVSVTANCNLSIYSRKILQNGFVV